MNSYIEHSKVALGLEEAEAAQKVILSGWVLEGELTRSFERQLSVYVGTYGSIAVSSGMLGIVLALKAVGVGNGDYVAVSTYICRSVIDAILMAGAKPFLCDIDRDDYGIDYAWLEGNFKRNIRCIILPHMFGIPSNYDKFTKFGVPIIEDCAQALGSIYRGKKCGSLGYISVFSFQATKMITTGEGGMVSTVNSEFYDKLKHYKSDISLEENYECRFNFTEMQSAIGIEQMKKLDSFIEKREAISCIYKDRLADVEQIELPVMFEDRKTNCFKFIIKVRNISERDRLIEKAYENFIKLRLPIAPTPIHHQYKHEFLNGKFENCEEVFERSVSLPLHPGISIEDAGKVVELIRKLYI